MLTRAGTYIVTVLEQQNNGECGTIERISMIKLKVFSFIDQRSVRRLILPAVVVFSLALSACQIVFLYLSLYPSNQNYTYDGQVCTFGAFFPSLHSYSSGDTVLRPEGEIRIGSFSLFARRYCAEQKAAPGENTKTTASVRYFHMPLYEKRLTMQYGTFPSISPSFNSSEPVSVLHPLTFSLASAEKFFDYELVAAEKKVSCSKIERTVACEIQDLELKHGSRHTLQVNRMFDGEEVSIAFKGEVSILEPVTLSSTFIGPDMVLYDSPTMLIVKANKGLSGDLPQVSLRVDGETKSIVSSAVVKDAELHISLSEPLRRKVSYYLEINNVIGNDSSTLEQPYKLSFTTSGGPRVSAISIRSVSVDRASDPVLTFDQVLLAKDFSANISLMNGSSPVAFSSRVSENRLTVVPRDFLPHCATLTLSVNEKIESQFGVSGDSQYSFSFRTTCFRTASIGTSVRGRSIVAYYFGYGGTTLLYIGAMHGGEISSKYTLDSWISDLDANYSSIPPDLTIIIIPSSNPDGVATGSRLNANGVDLNRNFPTSDWQSGIYTSSSSFLPTGGGSAPLSEPESKALADFIGAHRPRLTLSFHSQGSYVIANDGGDSRSQAARYSDLTGYQYFDSDNYSNAFEYSVTGTLDDWMRQAYGLSELLIELPGHGGNYFTSNKQALWKTLEAR